MKQKITKDTIIGQMVETYPELGEVLVEDYGFHCIGCFASGMETLEEGAMVHGYSKSEVKKMVETLNGILTDKAKEN